MTPRTDTLTLIEALRILVRDIHCEDGVATACIAEAADRLEEMSAALEFGFDEIMAKIAKQKEAQHG